MAALRRLGQQLREYRRRDFKGKTTPLVRGAGKPAVKLGKGKITVVGLPARAAVAELTMFRLKKIDGAPKRNAFKLQAPMGPTLKVRTKRLR